MGTLCLRLVSRVKESQLFTSSTMNVLGAVRVLLPALALGKNCTGEVDGNYEIGCRSYAKCVGGKAEIVSCDVDMAYNEGTGQCDDVNNVPPPCGQMKDCSAMTDGKYADMDNGCKTYYPCVAGQFAGHNFCPSTLLFNEKLQACDWPKESPCGGP